MAQVTTGYTWASGNTVTASLLNQSVNSATVTSIVNADIDNSAAIALSKLATGALPTAITVASANLVDGTIVNADINASAAIAGSKLADTSVAPEKLTQKLTFDTAKASTSGTNVDFTGIPAWAKRVTLLFSGVSTSGTSDKRIRLGVGGSFVTTGYVTSKARCTTAAANGSSTAGFEFMSEGQAAEVVSGQMVFTNVTGNTWVGSGQLATTSGNQPGALFSGGSIALSGALDSVRVTTVNGTDAFDAGTINISYEG